MAELTLEKAPRKARELFEKGFAAMERNNLDYAMDLFMSVLELEPQLLQARKFLRAAALKKFKAGKSNALTHSLSTIAGLGGVMKGMSAINKNPQEAMKSAEKLLRKDPLNMQFINMLGKAAVAADMPEVAIQTLEIAKEFYPKDANLLTWLGKLYIDTDQAHKARDCFEDVVKLRPNDPEAVKQLKDAVALATMQKGGWEDAQSYRDVIKDTKEATLLEQESKAVKSSKDVEVLISNAKTKIQQEPENINYYRSLADLYKRNLQYEKALEVLYEAQKLSAGDPQIDLAISTTRIAQFDGEINTLNEAGDTAGAKAKEKERDEFRLADARNKVERYPNDLQFRYDLGLRLFEGNNLNEAIQQFQQSQRNPQRRIRSLYYLALCFKGKEQYDIAVEQLEKAASELHLMDDTKKDILYELGGLCEMMDKHEQAADYYKEIYAVDIGYKDISEKIDSAYKQ